MAMDAVPIDRLRSSLDELKLRFQAVNDPGSPSKAWMVHVHDKGDKKPPIFGLADGYDSPSVKSSPSTWSLRGVPAIVPPIGPVVGPPKDPVIQRCVQLKGYQSLEAICEDAARLLYGLPTAVQKQLWSGLPARHQLLGDGLKRWVLAVFELGSANVVWSPLRCNRRYPSTGDQAKAAFAPESGLPADTDWYATLPDFAAASVQAIDILLHWVDEARSNNRSTPTPKAEADRQSKLPDSMPLGDWITQQLERFNAEPGDKRINYHASVWLPVAKGNADPGPSSVKVSLTADDPAQLVVEELQTRLERESVSLRDEFAKRFSPVEMTVLTIRDLRFSLQWTAEKLADDSKMRVSPPVESLKTNAAADDGGKQPAPTANEWSPDGGALYIAAQVAMQKAQNDPYSSEWQLPDNLRSDPQLRIELYTRFENVLTAWLNGNHNPLVWDKDDWEQWADDAAILTTLAEINGLESWQLSELHYSAMYPGRGLTDDLIVGARAVVGALKAKARAELVQQQTPTHSPAEPTADRSAVVTGKTPDGESSTPTATPPQPAIEAAATADTEETAKLLRCQWQAYYAAKYVEAVTGKEHCEAKEVWDWCRNNEFDLNGQDETMVMYLTGYEVPDNFATFETHWTRANTAMNENRYSPRRGRKGRSVVKADEV